MNQAIKRFSGVSSLVVSLPAFAQPAASAPASAPTPNPIVVPGDPTWMVIDVGIALVAGLIVGYLIGVWRSSAKARASHA